MIRLAAKVFGYVFIVVGVLGFVPALTPDGHLLGIFHVNSVHNIVHIASGIVALLAGYSSLRASRLYFQIFGVVYALVTLLGFVYGSDPILGIMANNAGDIVLHIVIAAAALYLGFAAPAKDEARA